MTSGPEDIQGKKLSPVGRCIYCGSDGGNDGLRAEHIMPFSLGGETELPEASCAKCEGVTSYLDGYLARSIYYHLRVHTGAPSRSGYPEALPAAVQLKDGEQKLLLATKDHPYFLNMPVWNTPAILRGKSPSAEFDDPRAHVYWSIPESMRQTLDLKDGEMARIDDTSRPINLPTFGRAIAKIGYCHAVARYGLDGFRPLVLPDLILGKYPCVPYFVGGDRSLPPPPTAAGVLHTMEYSDITYQRLRLIMVSFRIFAHSGTKEHGMPVYRVIVGAPKLGHAGA